MNRNITNSTLSILLNSQPFQQQPQNMKFMDSYKKKKPNEHSKPLTIINNFKRPSSKSRHNKTHIFHLRTKLVNPESPNSLQKHN